MTLDSASVATALDRLIDMDDVSAVLMIAMSDGSIIAHRARAECQTDLALAALAYAQIVRAQHKVIKALKGQHELEDIQITHSNQYHLMMRVEADRDVFMLVILERQRAGALGMVRLGMSQACRQISA